ncbi:MAG: hypothetical protein JOZ93_16870, partial [Sinobacteraceae bacterium]|nr:hypothetical protein [Nevskiaceae bacterium]
MACPAGPAGPAAAFGGACDVVGFADDITFAATVDTAGVDVAGVDAAGVDAAAFGAATLDAAPADAPAGVDFPAATALAAVGAAATLGAAAVGFTTLAAFTTSVGCAAAGRGERAAALSATLGELAACSVGMLRPASSGALSASV